jgi:drug/metabolite transporter (DMT)-like permease
VTAALALVASLLWGAADFLGGTAARRLPAHAVVLVSQGIALVLLVPVAAAVGGFTAGTGYLLWSLGAGAVGVFALMAFYSALATGTMGVVAPIAALGVLIPVVVGLVHGEQPTVLQVTGIVVAVLGVVLASGPELRPGGAGGRPLALAGLSAIGFGTVILLIARGAASSAVMTLLTMRVTSVALLLAILAVGRRLPTLSRADLPLLAAVGTGDVTANACFAVASRSGLLSVVAVLSSLYPAVTVLLAREVYGESLRRVQLVGVAAALAGVVLIAAGGGTG